MRLAVAALLLVACTDEPSSGGPDVTSRVETLNVMPGTPGCLVGTPVDVDPNTAGAQYECSVTKAASGQVYPFCLETASNQPCWKLETNTACTTGGHLELQIVPQVTEAVSAQCLVQ
jgi:hypothetical protein